MNRDALDAAIRSQFAAEAAWRYAETGEEWIPMHVFRFVDLATLHAVEKATGMRARAEGNGTYGTYVLDYGGCVFQEARKEAD